MLAEVLYLGGFWLSVVAVRNSSQVQCVDGGWVSTCSALWLDIAKSLNPGC
jgi:predicted amino acid dehydrogenase